ncbi:DUF1580 domain-containing protein [Roseiconus lacunae]|uniref:DUF1580 domain-containing protein n=1 Tax=Roseiconus lacunae TaxID=2605694 RepID=UPI0011F3C877
MPDDVQPVGTAIERVIGRSVSPATISRWSRRKNRHGVRLRTWVIGGRRYTTIDCVREFITRTSNLANANYAGQ